MQIVRSNLKFIRIHVFFAKYTHAINTYGLYSTSNNHIFNKTNNNHIKLTEQKNSGTNQPNRIVDDKILSVVNMKINKAISFDEVFYFFKKNSASFNMILYSTTLKKLSMFLNNNTLSYNDNQKRIYKIFELLHEYLKKCPVDKSHARSISNQYMYINILKASINEPLISKINEQLEKKMMDFYQDMNEQELINVILYLAKNNKADLIQKMLNYILKIMPKISKRALCTIGYSLSLVEIKNKEFYDNFKDMIINLTPQDQLHPQDYSFIFFICGKNPNQLDDPKIFQTLHNLAKYQASFLEPVGLGMIFHSLALFDHSTMPKEFYDLFEPAILNQLEKFDEKGIALMFSSHAIFGFGSPKFYEKFNKMILNKLKNFNIDDLSIILYYSAIKKNFNEELFAKSESLILKHKQKEISKKVFNGILYAYANLPQGIHTASNELLEYFERHILSIINDLNSIELSGLIYSISAMSHIIPNSLELLNELFLKLKFIKSIDELTIEAISRLFYPAFSLEIEAKLDFELIKRIEIKLLELIDFIRHEYPFFKQVNFLKPLSNILYSLIYIIESKETVDQELYENTYTIFKKTQDIYQSYYNYTSKTPIIEDNSFQNFKKAMKVFPDPSPIIIKILHDN